MKRSKKRRAAKQNATPVVAPRYQSLQEGLLAAEAALSKEGRQAALEILS